MEIASITIFLCFNICTQELCRSNYSLDDAMNIQYVGPFKFELY